MRVPVPIFPPVTITCNNNNVGYYVVSWSWQLLKYFQWHTYIFAMANVYVVTIKYILCEKFLMNSTCSYLCYSLSLLWSAGTSSWSLLWPLTNSTFLEITRRKGCCLLGQLEDIRLQSWSCLNDSVDLTVGYLVFLPRFACAHCPNRALHHLYVMFETRAERKTCTILFALDWII